MIVLGPCSLGTDNCTVDTATCVDQLDGSFKCVCMTGFQGTGQGGLGCTGIKYFFFYSKLLQNPEVYLRTYPANIRLDEDVLKTSFVFVFRRRLEDVLKMS